MTTKGPSDKKYIVTKLLTLMVFWQVHISSISKTRYIKIRVSQDKVAFWLHVKCTVVTYRKEGWIGLFLFT